jgi:hypothetical protein
MRVEQLNSDPAFIPVTITLDSQREVEVMIGILNVAYSHTDSNSSEEQLVINLRDLLRGGGWQSSDMNC